MCGKQLKRNRERGRDESVEKVCYTYERKKIRLTTRTKGRNERSAIRRSAQSQTQTQSSTQPMPQQRRSPVARLSRSRDREPNESNPERD